MYVYNLPRGNIKLFIAYEEQNIYDENLRGLMKEVMEHFNGFHDVFRVNERSSTCTRAIMNTCLFEWSMIALRIQYIYLFILHFPIDAPNKSQRIKFVYKEFVVKIRLLNRQIKCCARVKYYATINRLIHLTEILALGMQLNEIPWYGCFRCKTPFNKPQWKKNPIVKCLAEVQVAAVNIVEKHVGIPSECKCPPGDYHFPEEEEEIVEDEQSASEDGA